MFLIVLKSAFLGVIFGYLHACDLMFSYDVGALFPFLRKLSELRRNSKLGLFLSSFLRVTALVVLCVLFAMYSAINLAVLIFAWLTSYFVFIVKTLLKIKF